MTVEITAFTIGFSFSNPDIYTYINTHTYKDSKHSILVPENAEGQGCQDTVPLSDTFQSPGDPTWGQPTGYHGNTLYGECQKSLHSDKTNPATSVEPDVKTKERKVLTMCCMQCDILPQVLRLLKAHYFDEVKGH